MTPRAELANAIRALAMDAVQQANSGHPGMPMGMAEIAEVLWNRHLRHNPGNPAWADRDQPYKPKGGTGVGVRLLTQMLLEWQATD